MNWIWPIVNGGLVFTLVQVAGDLEPGKLWATIGIALTMYAVGVVQVNMIWMRRP